MSDLKQVAMTNTEEYPSKIEVTKNTKGFTWVISCRCKDGKELDLVNRIETLNGELVKRFKSEV